MVVLEKEKSARRLSEPNFDGALSGMPVRSRLKNFSCAIRPCGFSNREPAGKSQIAPTMTKSKKTAEMIFRLDSRFRGNDRRDRGDDRKTNNAAATAIATRPTSAPRVAVDKIAKRGRRDRAQ